MTLVYHVTSDLRERVQDGGMSALAAVGQMYEHAQTRGRVHQEESRLLLLEVLDLMASHELDNRHFLRQVLTDLYQISLMLDREIFLFEEAKHEGPMELAGEVKRKFVYVLSHVAGWKLPDREPWIRPTSPMVDYYLDLPFRRANCNSATHLMAELLYRLQDSCSALDLLRHGASPSCIYLWPVIVMLDMKFSLREPFSVAEPGPIEESNEARMIRYFCRARRHVYLNAIRGGEERGAPMPPGVNYEDVLLIPSSMMSLIPEDRYLYPAKLQHQCRLTIRQSLLDADCVPRGIAQLSLPPILQRYVDLLED